MRTLAILSLALVFALSSLGAANSKAPQFEKDLGVIETPWGKMHAFDRLRAEKVVPPRYPAQMESEGITGKVILAAWVGTDGEVKMVKVMTSSGFTALDSAAQDAMLKWRFRPMMKDGVAEEFVTFQPIAFRK